MSVRVFGLAVALVCCLATLTVGPTTPAQAATSAVSACGATSILADRYRTDRAAGLLALMNKKRAAHGVAPLKIDRSHWVNAMWTAAKMSIQETKTLPSTCSSPDTLVRFGAAHSGMTYDAILRGVFYGDSDRFLHPGYRSVGIGVVEGTYADEAVVSLGVNTPTEIVDNKPPIARSDSLTVSASGSTVMIPALENDSDPEGEFITILEAHGRNDEGIFVPFGKNDVISYKPTSGFQGTDTITYTLADLFGATSTGTVTVTVGSGTSGGTGGGKPAVHPKKLLVVVIGAPGSRVLRNNLRGMYVMLDATSNRLGVATLKVMQGKRVLGKGRAKVTRTGAAVRVTTIFPRAKMKPGRYTLVTTYLGKTSRLIFRVV